MTSLVFAIDLMYISFGTRRELLSTQARRQFYLLVLTRKLGQSIIIGDGIEITLVEVRRDGTVRLGITAPGETPVFRKEIWEKIRAEKAGLAEVAAVES